MAKTNLKKVVFFDLEMCCWKDLKDTGEIIEFSLVEVDIDSLEVTKEAQYYVKPDSDQISEFCTELTGITPKMVQKRGRSLSEVLASIDKKFGRNKVFMSWGRDDIIVLNECKQKGLDYEFVEFINFADVFRLTHGLDRISQVKAMKLYGLEFEGRQHSGLVDAQNLAKLAISVFKKSRFTF